MKKSLKSQTALYHEVKATLSRIAEGWKILARDCKFASTTPGECRHLDNISDAVDRCNPDDCPLT